MPKYEYVCPQAHRTEVLRHVDERHAPLECGTCGAQTTLGISVPGVAMVEGGTGAQSAG